MKQKSSATEERTNRTKQKLHDYLMESGNVSYSCKRAGVSRETYYQWRSNDRLFARNTDVAITYGKSFVNDLAHTQLILNIQKGDMQAIRFQLANCHEDYRPKSPVKIEMNDPPTYARISSIGGGGRDTIIRFPRSSS